MAIKTVIKIVYYLIFYLKYRNKLRSTTYIPMEFSETDGYRF